GFRDPHSNHGLGLLDFSGPQFGLLHILPLSLSQGDPLSLTLPNTFTLKFRKRRQNPQHQRIQRRSALTIYRDVLIDELHGSTLIGHLSHQIIEVTSIPTQPIHRSLSHRIPISDIVHQLSQRIPFGPRLATNRVSIRFMTLPYYLYLPVRALIHRTNPHIPYNLSTHY